MKKFTILFLLVLLSSCDLACSSESKITEEEFNNFISESSKSGDLNEILATIRVEPNQNKGTQLLEERFGKLNESKISQLFKLEIESLKRLDTINLGKTPAVFELDTIKKKGRRCGTFDSADTSALKAFSTNSRMKIPDLLPRKYFVPIEFHIINSNKNTWTPTENNLKEQISILNDFFSSINIVFTLSTISRDTNSKWAKSFRTSKGNTVFDTIYKNMVNTIEWENPSALHVYINENTQVLGQATLPFESDVYLTKFDHVLITKNSLNNRVDPDSGYQMMGKTLVHEVGHFFGLLHTFHSNSTMIDCDNTNYNGCNSPGDYVVDTPPQRYCHFQGCGKCINNMGNDCEKDIDCVTCDTCTYDDKTDDTTNLMGYNPDSCINHFSPGQYTRMRKFFFRNRDYLIERKENLFSF
ncbi:M43 family zinc metalloprotease [Croceitalea marina]|uniref:M43 family zinc metalloprotease n=1 Tax=Croceitalea marina TaxID=1775166 RepID=A0ABW5MXI7_9FLAO